MIQKIPGEQEVIVNDLTVYTGGVINATDGKGNVIVNCPDYPRGIVLSDSRDFPNLHHGRISLLVHKHGRTVDFSSLYLPEEEFREFLDHHGSPQVSLIETAMVKSRIKQGTHFFGNPRGLLFYDSSDKLEGAFPFAFVVKPNSNALVAGTRAALNQATGSEPEIDYSYQTENGYTGISGVSGRDFRDTLRWAFNGLDIAPVGIKNISVGSHTTRKRISCLTLRDCVEEFARYKR